MDTYYFYFHVVKQLEARKEQLQVCPQYTTLLSGICAGRSPKNMPREGPSTAPLPAHRTLGRTGRSAPENEPDSRHYLRHIPEPRRIRPEPKPLVFEDCAACWRRD